MNIKYYMALWGMDGTYEELIMDAASRGYSGIESPLPSADKQDEFKRLLAKYNMEYIAQVVTVGDHISSFTDQVRHAQTFEPSLIVSHSARDRMNFAEQVIFFEEALKVEREVGIPVGHETHRSRAMYTPWTTANLLRQLPDLKITADFSHWCCVCESATLEEHQEDVKLAMQRAIHIHGRVGYDQGPQVPHPAAPEYADQLHIFIAWWREILEWRIAGRYAYTSITPEFGPPGYMQTLPFTRQTVANLQEINEWMHQYLMKTLS